MKHHLGLLITAASILGCSPETEEPAPTNPIDTGELPYVVHDENEGVPEYDEDTLDHDDDLDGWARATRAEESERESRQ